MQILAHQKEQIDTLSLGIKAAQEDKLQNENKMVADALASLEAKRTLDEKYHRKHAKAIKKIKQKERKRRKQFADELQYYNLVFNNPYNPNNGYAAMHNMFQRPF